MYNYENEIKQINNRFLRYYIGFDYFHDSLVRKISYYDKKKLAQIELSCEREWPLHDWDQFADDENYIYRLVFTNCVYFEYERNNLKTYTEYLNGRFKNSARLQEITHSAKRHYYHLRIQLTDGYVDLVFRDFRIERFIGNIFLPKRITFEWYYDSISRRFSKSKMDEIISLAREGEFPLRSYALDYLWVTKNGQVVSLAREALSDENARIPAVFILGELGRFDDIKDLARIMSMGDFTPIFKRQIKDAIEKIIWRESKT